VVPVVFAVTSAPTAATKTATTTEVAAVPATLAGVRTAVPADFSVASDSFAPAVAWTSLPPASTAFTTHAIARKAKTRTANTNTRTLALVICKVMPAAAPAMVKLATTRKLTVPRGRLRWWTLSPTGEARSRSSATARISALS
jgi:hypothetical protein